MKTFSIFGGITLLALACGGAVCWVVGFGMLRQIMADGVSVSFNYGGGETQIPGALVIALVLTLSFACAIGVIWLLRSRLDRDDKQGT
ncbi:MAG: hypothetical protein ABIV39_04490 [Verrucomicrobiota bacterium]